MVKMKMLCGSLISQIEWWGFKHFPLTTEICFCWLEPARIKDCFILLQLMMFVSDKNSERNPFKILGQFPFPCVSIGSIQFGLHITPYSTAAFLPWRRGKQHRALILWRCQSVSRVCDPNSAPCNIFYATLFFCSALKFCACDIVSCKQQHITLSNIMHMRFP